MSKFTTSINEFNINVLEMFPARSNHQSFSDDERTLLNTNRTTLEHNPVIVDLTIMRETTHRCDTLFGQISLCHTGCVVTTFTNPVNFLVHLCAVEVSILTSTMYGATDTGRMPRSNTGNF